MYVEQGIVEVQTDTCRRYVRVCGTQGLEKRGAWQARRFYIAGAIDKESFVQAETSCGTKGQCPSILSPGALELSTVSKMFGSPEAR